MLNTIFLGLLDVFCLFYVINSLRPETKKSLYKREIQKLTRQIWDQEFKVKKTLQVKEGVRQDRDRLLDAKHKVEVALKSTPNDKKLDEDLAGIVETIRRYEAQMVMLDKQVNGVPADGENPGEEGITNTISSLAELRRMYKDELVNL